MRLLVLLCLLAFASLSCSSRAYAQGASSTATTGAACVSTVSSSGKVDVSVPAGDFIDLNGTACGAASTKGLTFSAGDGQIASNANFGPSADVSFSLGTSGRRWNPVHANQVEFYGGGVCFNNTSGCFAGSAGAGGGLSLTATESDGAAAVALVVNNTVALANASARLATFASNSSVKAGVDTGGFWRGTLHNTGAWSATMVTIALSAQNFGAYTPSVIAPGQQFGNVQCILNGAVAGTGAVGTLIIKDVTGASTLCTPFNGNFNCALAAGAATSVVSCAGALTAAHQYSYELSGCTTYPTGIECTAEVLSP